MQQASIIYASLYHVGADYIVCECRPIPIKLPTLFSPYHLIYSVSFV